MAKKILQYFLIVVCIPMIIIIGVKVFDNKYAAWISLCVTILACVPFFIGFEKGKASTKQMIIIAIMIAISVVGRIIFAPIPSFKPVTAIVVITAIYFGSQAGFMTGALTALISNFYFGQGPWTPLQMFAWGIVGLIAGIIAKQLKSSRIVLSAYGVLAGVLFSLIMDVWTVLWWDGYFNLTRYIAAIASSATSTVIYAFSNAIFLLILGKPIGNKLERIKDKYGLQD